MSLAATTPQDAPNDVGTLWTMRRSGHDARCALMAWVGEWELRVVVDGDTLLAERCPRGPEAFAIADLWKRRMLEQGWCQVLPTGHLITPTKKIGSSPSNDNGSAATIDPPCACHACAADEKRHAAARRLPRSSRLLPCQAGQIVRATKVQ